jgi:hypothetical protein
LHPKPRDCPRCDGTGYLIDSYDPERYDLVTHCDTCQMKCKACGKWVKKTGHACTEKQP